MVIDFGKLWAKLDKIGKWWLLICLLGGAAWSLFTKCNGYVQLPGRVDGVAEDVDSLKMCAADASKRDTIRALSLEAVHENMDLQSQRISRIEEGQSFQTELLIQLAIDQGIPVTVVRDTVKMESDSM